MATRYGLIAYKPNNVDTCRGCVMNQWDSGHVLWFGLTEEELAEQLYQVWLLNEHTEPYEASYEAVLLVDGRPVETCGILGDLLNYDTGNWVDDLHVTDVHPDEETQEELDNVVALCRAKIDAYQEQQREKARKKADEAFLAEQKAAEAKRVSDLAELKRLQEMYPGQ